MRTASTRVSDIPLMRIPIRINGSAQPEVPKILYIIIKKKSNYNHIIDSLKKKINEIKGAYTENVMLIERM